MSTGAVITVTGGIHAGASVLLSEGQDITIGNGKDANLVLVDDGVAARHATLRLDGDMLRLTAHRDGVRVFGYPLAAGKSTLLKQGALFTVGDAQIQFSGRDLPTPDAARSAQAAWLIAHEPLAYVAKRWALPARGARLTLMIVLVSAGAGALWQAYGPHDAGRRPPALDGPFRFVTMHEDPKTHANVYEGYVWTSQDLASLTAMVRDDTCASVMRVVVVDRVREQLAEFLTKYYRDAQISPSAPGAFSVTPPAADGYLLPESWDYARVARLAYESVSGLRDLGFEGQVVGGGAVRAPLRAIGMNLSRSPHGSWLVDAKGVRYFAGAQLPLGKIASIVGCTVTVVRSDDGTVYEFSAQGSTGNDEGKPCK